MTCERCLSSMCPTIMENVTVNAGQTAGIVIKIEEDYWPDWTHQHGCLAATVKTTAYAATVRTIALAPTYFGTTIVPLCECHRVAD